MSYRWCAHDSQTADEFETSRRTYGVLLVVGGNAEQRAIEERRLLTTAGLPENGPGTQTGGRTHGLRAHILKNRGIYFILILGYYHWSPVKY